MSLRTEAISMPESLTATEVARRFADVLNRVAYRRESFVVVRGKRPLAELRPLPAGTRLTDLPAILAALPRLEPSEADAFAADLDAARAELMSLETHDPWAS
jgi:antitoxin (DNA-binding transcriptional repressor) of toxin-antitoxin stability system